MSTNFSEFHYKSLLKLVPFIKVMYMCEIAETPVLVWQAGLA